MKIITILILIIVFITIAYFEIMPLYKQKKKKELYVYLLFYCTGFILSILVVFDVELPKISKGIETITKLIIGKQ